MSYERILRQKVRQLPIYPVPPSIRPRLVDRLGIGPGESHWRLPYLPYLPHIAAGLTAITLVALAVSSHPSVSQVPILVGDASTNVPDPSVDVDAAVRQANTWHFVGWKLVNGRKVHWEIWGRRNPLLYRETLGDQETFTTPTHTIFSLPSNYKNEAGGKIFVDETSPFRMNCFKKDLHVSYLVGTNVDTFRDEIACFRDAPHWVKRLSPGIDKLYVNLNFLQPFEVAIDSATGYPEAITIRDYPRSSRVSPTVLAELSTEYNVPIPDDCEQFHTVSDASMVPIQIEYSRTATGVLGSPSGDPSVVWSASGLTLRANQLVVDSDGNLRLRLAAMTRNGPFSPEYQHLHLVLGNVSGTVSDASGSVDIPVCYSYGGSFEEYPFEIILTAAEPIHLRKETPLHLTLSGSCEITAKIAPKRPMSSDSRSVPIFNLDSVSLNAPISDRAVPSSLSSSVPSAPKEDYPLTKELLYDTRANLCLDQYIVLLTFPPALRMTADIRLQVDRAPHFARLSAHWLQLAATEADIRARNERSRGDAGSADSDSNSATDYRKRAADALRKAVQLEQMRHRMH